MINNRLFVLMVALAICGCGKNGVQNSGVATMDELNQALGVMSMGRAHQPINLNDLTNFPTLRGKTLPKAPAGKKMVIDPAHNQVVLVDE